MVALAKIQSELRTTAKFSCHIQSLLGDNTSCMDECGVPNGDGISEGYCDCEYNIMGCDGECGSEKTYDICGICNGSSMNESDCNCENILETLDCLGECGGTAVQERAAAVLC